MQASPIHQNASDGDASLSVKELCHPLELVAALKVREEWAKGIGLEAMPRSRPGRIGLQPSDPQARHFGIYRQGRMLAYARCVASLQFQDRTEHRSTGIPIPSWKMDQLQFHPLWVPPGDLRARLIDILRKLTAPR